MHEQPPLHAQYDLQVPNIIILFIANLVFDDLTVAVCSLHVAKMDYYHNIILDIAHKLSLYVLHD